MPGVNAAQRLVDYLAKTKTISPQLPMVEALEKFFDYTPIEHHREHARRLELLLAQIDCVVDGLQKQGFPTHLYETQVGKARNAFTPSALNSQWNHVIAHVTPDVELAFMWAAYALPDDDDQIIDAILNDLSEEINSLKSDSMLAKLPQAFRDLITKYLDAILDAISNYSITGSEPLQKAVKDLAVKIILEEELLNAESSHVTKEAEPYFKKTKLFIKKTVDVVVAAGKGADGIDKVWKLVSDRGPLILELFNSAKDKLN